MILSNKSFPECVSKGFNMKDSPLVTTSRLTIFVFLTLLFAVNLSVMVAQQQVSSLDRERGHVMLHAIKEDLKKNYYDPDYHGMDLETRFKSSDEKINEANSVNQIFGIIAQTLIDLDDSHTFFVPPARSNKIEYGWRMKMIGDKCYAALVKPGSDAEAKGLKEGDEIYAIDGFGPTRENLWKIEYSYFGLRPRASMHLFVIKPDGERAEFDVLAKVKPGKPIMDLTFAQGGSDTWDLIRQAQDISHLRRHRYLEMGDGLFIWKMPAFDLDESKVDDMVGKFKKSQALVLDLRGNGGGYERTLLRLLGNVLDHDVKLGDIQRRKEAKPIVAKTRKDVFAGKLVVLIDSESGSAAELFARTIQMEKRGTVIGDRSAGAVMRAMFYDHQTGLDVIVPYGVSITDADIITPDGKSLEHVGVTPDKAMIPTPADMAAKRDPVLAYAISLVGGKISPEKAGELFPIEWLK
jgi:C-terminal processing protease CtpA/Prc